MQRKHELTAFIYDKKGNLLSMGKNSYVKTHPLQAKYAKENREEYKHFLHAEIAAIIKCKQIERAHKLVVMRLNNEGKQMLAKPCKICQRAISFTPIKVIEHS